MCDYCEKRKELTSCNFCGDGKMRIIKDELDLYEKHEKGRKIKFFRRLYGPAFRINYCPMCGKQLRKDKLK